MDGCNELLNSVNMPVLVKRDRAKVLVDTNQFDELITIYREWVEYPLYLVFTGFNIHDFNAPLKHKAALASKRGNKVHRLRINKSLEAVNEDSDLVFYDWKDVNKVHKTKAVFVTLTFKRDFNPSYAWENVGKYWAKYADYIQHHFNGVEFLRCWESHQDGFPHIHCLMLFKNYEFEVFSQVDFINGLESVKWRVHNKKLFEWENGHVDVLGIASMKNGLSYLNKYLMKSTDSTKVYDKDEQRKRDLTLCLTWAFSKRCFAVSKRLADLIKHLRNLDRLKVKKQVTLAFEPLFKWVLNGFYGGDLGFWSREISTEEFNRLKSSDTFRERDYSKKPLRLDYDKFIDA